MKRLLLASAIVFAGLPAFADATATSGSQSSNAVNVNAYAVSGGAATSGSSHQKLSTTPDANAPMISGGNPCVVGMSAGISVTGFGLSGGSMFQDKECELRQQAALLANMGLRQEAVAILCQNDDKMQKALATTGRCSTTSAPPVAPMANSEGVCRLKPGTNRTIVTNWPDRMACARSLGLR